MDHQFGRRAFYHYATMGSPYQRGAHQVICSRMAFLMLSMSGGVRTYGRGIVDNLWDVLVPNGRLLPVQLDRVHRKAVILGSYKDKSAISVRNLRVNSVCEGV